MNNASIDEKLISEKQAARLLNKCPKTLQRWRAAGVAPTYTKLPTGSILYRLTKNRSGRLVPLARAIMKHTPLAVLTAEQEAELFAPVNTERVSREPVEDAEPKSYIDRQIDKIRNNNSNSNKKNAKPLDMRAGGLVRKSN